MLQIANPKTTLQTLCQHLVEQLRTANRCEQRGRPPGSRVQVVNSRSILPDIVTQTEHPNHWFPQSGLPADCVELGEAERFRTRCAFSHLIPKINEAEVEGMVM